MKRLLALALLTIAATPAHAMHVYANYSCKAGNISLNYDGPGSNYAFGGYSNFYVTGNKTGSLAYENSDGDKETVGNDLGDSGKVEATFTLVDIKKVSEPKVEKGGDECGSYDHSEWNSIRTVKIEDISAAASKKLGLKAGSTIRMACNETSDVPSGDCSK